MAEVITYDALREIQRNERKSERLVDLNDSFYESIESYLNRKGPKDDLTEIEMRNAGSILHDILDRRERKVLNQALVAVRSSMKIDTNMMTSQEKDLFNKLVDILKKHREEATKNIKTRKKVKKEKEHVQEESEDTQAEEKTEEEEETVEKEPTISYIKVKILEELPEIVGADFDTYGPFKEGDIVKIPQDNADIFIEKGKAEKV